MPLSTISQQYSRYSLLLMHLFSKRRSVRPWLVFAIMFDEHFQGQELREPLRGQLTQKLRELSSKPRELREHATAVLEAAVRMVAVLGWPRCRHVQHETLGRTFQHLGNPDSDCEREVDIFGIAAWSLQKAETILLSAPILSVEKLVVHSQQES